MMLAGEQLLAHPVALLAIPAFIPAIALVVVVLYIARKDRQAEREEQALVGSAMSRHTE